MDLAFLETPAVIVGVARRAKCPEPRAARQVRVGDHEIAHRRLRRRIAPGGVRQVARLIGIQTV